MKDLQIGLEYNFVIDEIIWGHDKEYVKGLKVRDHNEDLHFLPLREYDTIKIKEGNTVTLKVKDYNENTDKYFFNIIYDVNLFSIKVGMIYSFIINKIIYNDYTKNAEAIIIIDIEKNTHYYPLPDFYTKDHGKSSERCPLVPNLN